MMSRIAIASMFRNSANYVSRSVDQFRALTDHLTRLGYDIHLIMAEGDSSDGTYALLTEQLGSLYTHICKSAPDSTYSMIKADHGGPTFPSIDDPVRWKNISFVCNMILEHVTTNDDFAIYVESDLIWDVTTLMTLLHHVESTPQIAAIAPLCISQQTGVMYDIWGHRKNGQRFVPTKPYHPEVGEDLTEIDSAGSCIVMRAQVARSCRFTPPELGIVGFGNDIREKGYHLFLDPKLAVYHP